MSDLDTRAAVLADALRGIAEAAQRHTEDSFTVQLGCAVEVIANSLGDLACELEAPNG